MARKLRKSSEDETSYWLSYSDMMAALLLVFALIISFTMYQANKGIEKKEGELESQKALIEDQKNQLTEQQEKLKEQQEQLETQKVQLIKQQEQMADQQKKLDRIIGIRSDLITALKTEFEGSDLKVSVDPQTGAITFDSSVLFDRNKDELKGTGTEFLDKFLPRYFNVLLKDDFIPYISEIIVEGHTDTRADYMYNLELSQQRALSVAKYFLDEKTSTFPKEKVEKLQKIVTANGRSFSDPIKNDDDSINMDASRRVEFKFRLKDEEMIDEMSSILSEAESVN